MSVGRAKFEISRELKYVCADIWDGVTKCAVSGDYGHDEKYWKDAANLPKEAFADMFAATVYNKESLDKIVEYFPKSYRIFIEILEDYLKESGD